MQHECLGNVKLRPTLTNETETESMSPGIIPS